MPSAMRSCPVIKGELKAHFHCHRADDIFTAIRLAKEFHLDYVLVHCTEGHLIAQELAEEGALCHHRSSDDHPQQAGACQCTDRTGCSFAAWGSKPPSAPTTTSCPSGLLPICAGMAVREGMDYQQALAAITIYPAQIVGIDHRVAR